MRYNERQLWSNPNRSAIRWDWLHSKNEHIKHFSVTQHKVSDSNLSIPFMSTLDLFFSH